MLTELLRQMRGVVVMFLYPGRMFQEGMGTLLLEPLRPARFVFVLTPNFARIFFLAPLRFGARPARVFELPPGDAWLRLGWFRWAKPSPNLR